MEIEYNDQIQVRKIVLDLYNWTSQMHELYLNEGISDMKLLEFLNKVRTELDEGLDLINRKYEM